MKVSAQELEFNLTSIDSQSLVHLLSNVSINLQGTNISPTRRCFWVDDFPNVPFSFLGATAPKNEHENLKISP